jgi:acyl-CoA thioesterase
MPDVPGPDDVGPVPRPGFAPPVVDRVEPRPALGTVPGSRSDRAESGGWLRLEDGRPVDHLAAAFFMDAWIPAVFSRFDEPVGVPTVDLTVHFRAPLPRPADDWYLCRFRTTTLVDGFLEEDGELWAPDGTLVAQSRQLALTLPISG